MGDELGEIWMKIPMEQREFDTAENSLEIYFMQQRMKGLRENVQSLLYVPLDNHRSSKKQPAAHLKSHIIRQISTDQCEQWVQQLAYAWTDFVDLNSGLNALSQLFGIICRVLWNNKKNLHKNFLFLFEISNCTNLKFCNN